MEQKRDPINLLLNLFLAALWLVIIALTFPALVKGQPTKLQRIMFLFATATILTSIFCGEDGKEIAGKLSLGITVIAVLFPCLTRLAGGNPKFPAKDIYYIVALGLGNSLLIFSRQVIAILRNIAL